jgi:hypothetical protein
LLSSFFVPILKHKIHRPRDVIYARTTSKKKYASRESLKGKRISWTKLISKKSCKKVFDSVTNDPELFCKLNNI